MQGHTQQRLINRTRGLTAIALLLAANSMVIAASGCGETNRTRTVASQGTTTAATGATGGAQATSSTAAAPSGSQTEAQSASSANPASTSRAANHSRAHLALPGPNSRLAPKLTAAQRANVAVSDIALSSPAITQAHYASAPTLNRRYTCQGADQSPPLHWSRVPPGTKELALLVISTTPFDGKLFYDWAVAGLNPNLKGLKSGALPTGAVTGRNGNRQTAYSICPTGAKHESYVFLLYALPQSLSPQQGFDPATLRQQAMRIARHTGLLIGTYG